MIEKKIKIHYYAGESNYLGHGRQPIAVDYLISDPLDDLPAADFGGPIFGDAAAADLIRVGGKYHLYAESPASDDETATYDGLKTEIIDLAKKIGIDTSRLVFLYDE